MGVRTVLVDDLDGTTQGVRTVEFSVGRQAYSIDLNAANRKALRGAVAPYTAVATPNRRYLPAPAEEIRAWGRRNGFTVNDAGRLSSELIAAYAEAHPDE